MREGRHPYNSQPSLGLPLHKYTVFTATDIGTEHTNPSNASECSELTRDDYVKIIWTSAAELPGTYFLTLFKSRTNTPSVLSGQV